MTRFRLRTAAREDLREVRRLVEVAQVAEGIEHEPAGADDDLYARSEDYFRPRARMEVAVEPTPEGPRIVGVAGVLPRSGDTAELRKLYVTASVRGAGLGARLVRSALAFAASEGYHSIVVQTSSTLAAALRLYSREGFVPGLLEARSPSCDVFLERPVD